MNPKSILISRLEDMRLSLAGREALQAQPLADETELTRIVADREIEATRQTTCASTVKQILDAMNRVDSDEYGICVDCEEEISERRLSAIPWALRCVSCQEKEDRREADVFVRHPLLKERMAA